MSFKSSDIQKINALLSLASKGLIKSSGNHVYAQNCPCGGTCSGDCTGSSTSGPCQCQGGCSGFLTIG